jgi:hypothetical protein
MLYMCSRIRNVLAAAGMDAKEGKCGNCHSDVPRAPLSYRSKYSLASL